MRVFWRRKRERGKVCALEIGQWLSAGIVLCGIVCEITYKADVYLIFITAGTFSWAVVQKIKHPRK